MITVYTNRVGPMRGFLLLGTALIAVRTQGATIEPTLDAIIDFVKRNPVTKLEDVLAVLPESYRSQYTLMHESMSSQGASAKNPRVIMFGEDGRTILSFNGDPRQRSYGQAELMQWREDLKRFEFREIKFPRQGELGHATVSGANPAVCLTCHVDGRPNWDAFKVWKGSFGEMDDNLRLSKFKNGTPVLSAFREFQAMAPNHPRYKYLHALNMGEGVYPFHALSKSRHLGLMPNSRLTFFLSLRNAERITEKMRRSPLWSRYGPALAGHLQADGSPELIKIKEAISKELRILPNLEQRGVDMTFVHEIMKAMGITTDDLNMTFHRTPKEQKAAKGRYVPYEHGLSVKGQSVTEDLVAVKLREAIAKEFPQLVHGFRLGPNYRAMEDSFFRENADGISREMAFFPREEPEFDVAALYRQATKFLPVRHDSESCFGLVLRTR